MNQNFNLQPDMNAYGPGSAYWQQFDMTEQGVYRRHPIPAAYEAVRKETREQPQMDASENLPDPDLQPETAEDTGNIEETREGLSTEPVSESVDGPVDEMTESTGETDYSFERTENTASMEEVQELPPAEPMQQHMQQYMANNSIPPQNHAYPVPPVMYQAYRASEDARRPFHGYHGNYGFHGGYGRPRPGFHGPFHGGGAPFLGGLASGLLFGSLYPYGGGYPYYYYPPYYYPY
jgi:hypothetical protein